jgi:tetratricopeptide (TPR) repeat protein
MIHVLKTRARSLAIVALAAALLLGIGGLLGLRQSTSDTGRSAAAPPASTVDRLTAAIGRAQDRLRLVPGDYVTWAALGSSYLERGRITADPSFYPKAEGALRRSLQLRSGDNARALTGLGALANARHDFAGAREMATQALHINPYDADAYGVLTDAETQLGHASAATDAAQRMLDLRPGLAAYARASYDLEQHGRITDAQALMSKALDAAVDPADIAFCRYQVGELAWQSGNLDEARTQYQAGLAADATYLPLQQGRAKVAAAQGRVDAALADYADITRRTPTPTYFIEHAELLSAEGRSREAAAVLGLADAALRLFTANGGTDDLTGAVLALAQSRPDDAVRLARQEWQRRQFAEVADTLGWALHRSGDNGEALDYALRAGSLGPRNAKYTFHLAMIELAAGDRAAARRDLAMALQINPHFSPLDAPVAVRTLAGLGS